MTLREKMVLTSSRNMARASGAAIAGDPIDLGGGYPSSPGSPRNRRQKQQRTRLDPRSLHVQASALPVTAQGSTVKAAPASSKGRKLQI